MKSRVYITWHFTADKLYFFVSYIRHNSSKQLPEFYVHGIVHLSNTDHINANEMQLFLCSLFGVKSCTCFGCPLRPSSGAL